MNMGPPPSSAYAPGAPPAPQMMQPAAPQMMSTQPGGYVPEPAKAGFMTPPASQAGPGYAQSNSPGYEQGGVVAGAPQAALAAIDYASQCDARYMRCTVGKFGNSAATQAAAKVPFGVVCQPMALDTSNDGVPLEVVNFGSTGIVRCKKCRAYINPFVSWVNNGRQWRCNVCGFVNDVPNSYFCQLDPETGQRRDRDQRPELRDGSVELVAPGEYMVRPPQPPVYVFVLDVSAAAVANGSVAVAAGAIGASLDSLPGAPRTQFALITYDAAVHFYSLKATLRAPQMLCVADLADFFVPLPDDLLVNLAESRAQVDQLLDSLAAMHGGGGDAGAQGAAAGARSEAALGSALTAAYRVMGHVGGKLCVFVSALPSVGEAPLKQRENPRAYGTDQERLLLHAESAPEPSWYETKAIEFSRLQIGVELFITAAAYCDVATLAVLPKVTAGQLYHYPGFAAHRDGEKLDAEVRRALTRPTGFEAVMRVRCTRGLRVTAFRGNYYIRGHDLLALPNCSAESVFVLELAHDEAPLTAGVATVQASLLYTTSSGERRIRVHTLVAPVTSSVAEIVASADVDALVNVMAKSAVDVALKSGLEAARSKLQAKCVEIIGACRADRVGGGVGQISNYATQSMPGYRAAGPAPGSQPQAPQAPKLPDALQLLPLYTMSLLKCSAFRGGVDVRADERAFVLQRLDNMSPDDTRYYVYPRLFALHALPGDAGFADGNGDANGNGAPGIVLPPPCNLSAESLTSDGVFLLDNSLQLFVWLGAAVPQHLFDTLFYVQQNGEIALKPADGDANSLASRAQAIIAELRSQHAPHLHLEVVREGDPQRAAVFFRHLVEDHAAFSGGQFSYQEFMAHIQRS
ncbi:Sec23/Sec24 trunk domain-containing protein [Pelagophyceae sp. CCMP2097]|nr:Sec23/Sec24 trunk domain-containing protein [Pelagophyceae sp. CCMP2097]